jgi:putative tryptophan/tyrosine transport system substrate-binding protein
VNRRSFITMFGGSAAAWPLAVRAQQTAAMRRVVVFMSTGEDDPQDATRLAAFERGLQELGWAIGRNLSIDYHWAAGDPDSLRKYATEMRVLAPDAIVASGNQAVTAAQQTTRTVPIVFVNVIDPVSAGFVSSLAQPGGNTTGFLMLSTQPARNGLSYSSRSRQG